MDCEGIKSGGTELAPSSGSKPQGKENRPPSEPSTVRALSRSRTSSSVVRARTTSLKAWVKPPSNGLAVLTSHAHSSTRLYKPSPCGNFRARPVKHVKVEPGVEEVINASQLSRPSEGAAPTKERPKSLPISVHKAPAPSTSRDKLRAPTIETAPAKTESVAPVSALPPVNANPVKSKQEEDIAALLEGCDDWDLSFEHDLPLEPEIRQAPLPSLATLPLCRQYLRARVVAEIGEAAWVPKLKRVEKRVCVDILPDFMDEQPGNSGSGLSPRGPVPREPLLRRELVLADDWVATPLASGSRLHLIALPASPPFPIYDGSLTFCREEPRHLVVLHPDTLISCTAVATAPTCARRSVLQERLKSSRGDVGEAVVAGNIIHEVVQKMLVRGLKRIDEDGSGPEVFRFDDEDDGGSQDEGPWQLRTLFKEARKTCERHVNDLFMLGKSVEEGFEMVRDKLKELPAWSARYLAQVDTEAETATVNDTATLTDVRARSVDRATLPRVAITGVYDIEEEIWSPKFGLKGKVDASIRALITTDGNKAAGDLEGMGRVMPFEIKTGRSVASMDHRAQTMLYTLIMSDRYTHKHELRQLIIARNELADFASRAEALKETEALIKNGRADEGDLIKAAAVGLEELRALPEPIDDERKCGWCYAQDGCMLYRKTLERVDQLSPRPGLESLDTLYQTKTSHLTPTHINFFNHWDRLISLEESETGRFKREIWNSTAEQRQRCGRAIANLEIDPTFDASSWPSSAKSNIHRFTYRLRPTAIVSGLTRSAAVVAPRSLLGGQITENEPVVLSIEGQKLALARGFVLELTPHYVVVGIDHQLTKKEGHSGLLAPPQALDTTGDEPSIFRLDKDELTAGMSRIRDNLAQLFYANGDTRLRELVVDMRPPRFAEVAHRRAAPKGLDHLNEDQQNAISRVAVAQDYALILGMPGTGKTTTIVEVIKALVACDKSILLTSYTHSAVDNILTKLIESDSELALLRLGNRDKVHPSVRVYTLDEQAMPSSVEELEERFLRPQVVATTSLSINHPLFAKRRFDYCIVDEASQITLPTCLGPLRFANIFVLVGDHHQLPPLVKSTAAKSGGLEVSLFKQLSDARPESVIYLTRQYRMNQDIMALSNALVYGGKLVCGDENVAEQRLQLPRSLSETGLHTDTDTECRERCWIADVLDPWRKVVFVDTDQLPAYENRVGTLIQNEVEAGIVYQLVASLLRSGLPSSAINVLTPYRQQIKLINYVLASLSDPGHSGTVPVLTADKSQGRDADCIIVSLVRSNEAMNIGDLLKDWRRVNVCVTRAKRKLVLVGSRSTLKGSHPEPTDTSGDPGGESIIEKLIDEVEKRGWVYRLRPDDYGKHPIVACPVLEPRGATGSTLVKRARNPVDSGDHEEGRENNLSNRSPGGKRRKPLGSDILVKGRPFLKDVLNDEL